MELKRCYHTGILGLAGLLMATSVLASEGESDTPAYGFAAGATTASKYIWRGQRLTSDWVLQTSATANYRGFSVNVWGNLDLAAVNEGDAIPIPENPLAPPGASGLQGKFSEIDYTLAYTLERESVTLDFGSVIYTFPERSASLPSTTEIFGSVTLNQVPLNPSATLYLDVDESSAGDGTTAAYLLLAAGQSIPFRHSRFPGLDLSFTLGFANAGFGNFYYGQDTAGAHDLSVTASLPINLGEHWSATAFITSSSLLGEYRNHQYLDARKVYRGTSGSPSSLADTVWGGIALNLSF